MFYAFKRQISDNLNIKEAIILNTTPFYCLYSHYLEDLEPLGLNFIKLGLQDVLFNPETKQIYTPNTNQTSTITEKGDSENERTDNIQE